MKKKKMENKKSGKKAVGIAMAAIMITSILATFAPAFGYKRPVSPLTGEPAIFYLSPRDSRVTSYPGTTEVQLHVNFTNGGNGLATLAACDVNITYNPLCANITGWTVNSTNWQTDTHTFGYGYFKLRVSRGTWPDLNPGDYHLGNLTIQCNSTECCATIVIPLINCKTGCRKFFERREKTSQTSL